MWTNDGREIKKRLLARCVQSVYRGIKRYTTLANSHRFEFRQILTPSQPASREFSLQIILFSKSFHKFHFPVLMQKSNPVKLYLEKYDVLYALKLVKVKSIFKLLDTDVNDAKIAF